MSLSPLGVHFIPTHVGRHHYDYIRDQRPGIVKIVGGSMPDVGVLSAVYEAAPDALFYWRNHAISEQHDDLWRDPAGTAQRHVRELVEQVDQRYREAAQRGLKLPDRQRVRILGINEPILELFPRFEDGRNLDQWTRMVTERANRLDMYMSTFGQSANANGLGAGLGNLSTGQPPNRVPGGTPTLSWFPATVKLLERSRERNALAVHEYWSSDRPLSDWWGWHPTRFFHYEARCDIHVLECGIDDGIIGFPKRGWVGQRTPAQYADEMETYLRRCLTDERFGGATPFTLDGNRDWTLFYVEGAAAAFVELGTRLRTPVTSPTVESAPGNFERALAFILRWEGGFSDHPQDPGGATMKGITLATYRTWRAAHGQPVPTVDDLRNITDAEVRAIYEQWYWHGSGASELPWPLALAHFDLAVNAGAGVAKTMLEKSGGDFLRYMGEAIGWFTRIDNFETFGRGWIRRRAELMLEAGR